MNVIGITGTLGAGKGTIVEFLKAEYGFDHYSVRGYLIEEINKRSLEVNRDSMTIMYKDKKGILTFQAGNTSIIGNEFLLQNPDYDFFLDINGRKNISTRANNNCDVSVLASKVFGGGGHANASGGRFPEFKESFIYEDIKEQVQKRIKDKE